MKPYGPWLVIAPFNFPLALAGGPTGAALVAGNTVVLKPATATPWSARLLALALRDAGVPPGVFNCHRAAALGVGEPLVARSARRGRDVHRQLRRGHAPVAHVRAGPLAAAVHRRDGRQERGDRDAATRTSPTRSPASRARRSGSPARSARRARACTSSTRVYRRRRRRVAPGGAEGVDRRSDAARALDGAGDRRRRRRALRGRRRARARARRRRRHRARRRAARPRRPRARPLRRADDRARAARPSAVDRGAVRAVRAGRAGRDRSTKASRARTRATTG